MSTPRRLKADVPSDHPRVVMAMNLYDEILTDEEKRNVHLTAVIAAVSAVAEQFEGDRLRVWAESMAGWIVLHSDPKAREAIRAALNRPRPKYEDCVDAADVIAGLRGEGGAR